MRLEKIEALTEEVLLLHLEDGSSFRCGPQELLDFGLRPGLELGEEALEKLREACAYWAVRRKAAALAAERAMSAGAGAQHPIPLAVDFQMFPDDMGHVPAHDQIESALGVIQMTEIPLPEFRAYAEGLRVFPGVIQHPLRAVDAGDDMTGPGQQNREKTGTAAGVQHPQRTAGRGVFLDLSEPFRRTVGFEFIQNIVVEIV